MTDELSPELRKRVDDLFAFYCDRKVPSDLRAKLFLDYEITGPRVVLYENRPLFIDPKRWNRMAIACFDYDSAAGTWELLAYDRDSELRPYDFESTEDLSALLREVDEDPTGIFYG